MPSPPQLQVLYEDNHLLVVDKPAGLATMGVADDKPSLLSVAREYIKHKYNKPGNVYLGIVSRLDAPVTGVLVLARTSKAASRLTEAFRSRQVDKSYLALVEGHPKEESARLEDYLRKDERHRRVHTTHAEAQGAQFAALNYEVLEELADKTLLKVTLETGRKHQIRVQLAKLGHPICGDRKYGSKIVFPPGRNAQGIGLHSWRLTMQHPVGGNDTRGELALQAPLPPYWPKLQLPTETNDFSQRGDSP